MRLRALPDPDSLPALDRRYALHRPASGLAAGPRHPARILLLYGSLREHSYSRLVIEEAARLLRFFGGEPHMTHRTCRSQSDQGRQPPGSA
jgi:arsenic resistance protein ArsH